MSRTPPIKFMQAAGACIKILKENAVTGEGLPTHGTQVLMNVINETGALPTHNGADVQFEGASKIGAEAMQEPRASDGKANLVSNAACFGCPISCQRVSQMDPEHFAVKGKPKYHGTGGGLEYEAAWALGAATGVSDLEALTYCNFVCNEYGMDPISLGATVGAAMEGALQGIRSIAMSQCYTKESQLFDDSFETARHLGANICSKLITESDWDVGADNIFYNVNFPAVRVAEVAGLSACIQGRRSVGSFSMDSIKSPNGRTFLMVNHRPANLAVETDKSYKTDLDEIKNNYVTITPLKTNLTELNYLGKLQNILKNEY